MSDGQSAAATEEAEAGAANATGDEIASLKAEISRLQKGRDDDGAKLFKLREAERERKQKVEEAQRRAGEFEPLLAERDQTISELKAYEDDAKSWRAHLAAEQEALEAEAADLDEGDRAALAAVTDLQAKRHLLQKLKGGSQNKPPPPDEHPAGNPAGPKVHKTLGQMTPEERKADRQARKAKQGFSVFND